MAHASLAASGYVSALKNALNTKVQAIIREEARSASERVTTRVMELAVSVGIDLQTNYDIARDVESVNVVVKLPDVKG